MLETRPLELIFIGPTNISQVLAPYSAASPPKVLLSGFRSRCHIVVKGAFPEFRVRKGLDQLIHLYTLAGVPNEELQTISSEILTQHQNLQPHENRASLSRWFFTFCDFPFCCFTCYFLFFITYFDVSFASNSDPISLAFQTNFQWNSTPWKTPMAVKSTTIWLGLLNYIAGFLPFFEPSVDWDDHPQDLYGRTNQAPHTLGTFIPSCPFHRPHQFPLLSLMEACRHIWS